MRHYGNHNPRLHIDTSIHSNAHRAEFTVNMSAITSQYSSQRNNHVMYSTTQEQENHSCNYPGRITSISKNNIRQQNRRGIH